MAGVFAITGGPVGALFTGTDQYNLDDLNSEAKLDKEYLVDLAAFRPFWRPLAGENTPRAFIRNSEGSLNSDQLYIEREAGFRASFSTGTFLGYQLRQRDDVEEMFLTQYFEGEVRLVEGVTARVTGQPTAKKQDADIGVGVELRGAGAWAAVEHTWVDFNFNDKNQDNEKDRRRLYDAVARAGWARGNGAVEIRWEWESPVERERPDEGQVFFHRAQRGEVKWRAGAWTGDVAWDLHRRALDDPAGVRQQSFEKDAARGGVQWEKTLARHDLGLGLEAHRRSAVFVTPSPAEGFERDLWECIPYGRWTWRWSDRWSLPAALYTTWAWEDRREGASLSESRRYSEFKLVLPLRLDWTPDVTLALMTSWDLNPASLSSVFDGGNAMFRAQWP